MAKGWKYESRRHSLASKGVKTAVKGKPTVKIPENDSILPNDSYVGDKLLEQKQLLLIKSGIPIGRWQRKTDDDDYIVWGLPQEPMRNPHNIVIRKEGSPNKRREWVTFVDMGSFGGGTSILNRGGTKGENLLIAKDYMMKRK